MIDWKIYYGDGTVVDSNTPIESVPANNVMLIVQKDPDVQWAMLHGREYYVWFDGGYWQSVDLFGLHDYLLRDGWKRVLFGRWMTRQEFNSLYRIAKDDRDFARKAGFLRSELSEELEK